VYYEIVEGAGSFYSAMLIAFTFFCKFSFFNILTGLYIEKVAGVVKSSARETTIPKRKQTKQLTQSGSRSPIASSQDDSDTRVKLWQGASYVDPYVDLGTSKYVDVPASLRPSSSMRVSWKPTKMSL